MNPAEISGAGLAAVGLFVWARTRFKKTETPKDKFRAEIKHLNKVIDSLEEKYLSLKTIYMMNKDEETGRMLSQVQQMRKYWLNTKQRAIEIFVEQYGEQP